MKVRSRSGCLPCKKRRIKCDENRPVCKNCTSRDMQCTYAKEYQWFIQEIISPTNAEEEKEFIKKRGPLKRKRHESEADIAKTRRDKKIAEHFKHALKTQIKTQMIETDFTPQDDPITELNGPGSLSQFKKFVIVQPPQINIHPELPQSFLDSSMSSDDFHFNFYVKAVADTLVPSPYEENPFLYLLPRLAQTNPLIKDVLIAFGASSQYIFNPASIRSAKVQKYISVAERHAYITQQENENESLNAGGNGNENGDEEELLVCYVLLSLLHGFTGNATKWLSYLKKCLKLLNSRQSWELVNELNTMSYRLIGHSCVLANLTLCVSNPLKFPVWPEWSGSYDFLTGMDLNFVHWYNDAAIAIYERDVCPVHDLAQLSRIYAKALRLLTLFNDFTVMDFLPDSDISALGILFQEAIKLHLLRRVIKLPTQHRFVQNLVNVMFKRMDCWIPSTAPIQRCMVFILVTLASETVDPILRNQLTLRLHLALKSGFRIEHGLISQIEMYWGRGLSIIENSQEFFML